MMTQETPIYVLFAIAAVWGAYASLRWHHWHKKWKRADAAARYYSALSSFPMILVGPLQCGTPLKEQAEPPQGDNVIPVDFGNKPPKPDGPKPL